MTDLNYEFKLGDRKLRMSYGLLNELASAVETPENLPAIFADASLRTLVLYALLVEREPDGTPKDGDVLLDDLTPDEAMNLLEWAMEHITDFFIQMVERAARVSGKFDGKASVLMSSLNGSESSASKTPSAGPSAASPPTSPA